MTSFRVSCQYWLPLFNLLDGQLTVWLVNAHHVKQVPGRKTDVKDAEWLAQLLQHGLLKPSYSPPAEQRQLRDLTRSRQTLGEARRRIANRLHKVLETANITLTAVVTQLQGLSAQAMLRALVDGQTDPEQLADLARGKLRKKRAALEQALAGRFTDHHRFLLARLLEHLDFLDEEVATLDTQIEACLTQLPAFATVVELLDTIPGINRTVALIIVAEIGVDMRRYPSDRHLAAWAGLAPGNNETAGKQRATSTRKGNRYLSRALVQAAWAASKKRDSYLKALFHRIASRRGVNRAIVAVAWTLLQTAYHVIDRGEPYQELGGDYFDRFDRNRTRRRLIQRLEALGFAVTVQEVEPPAGDRVPAPV